MTTNAVRQPHASLDIVSRNLKAEKIFRLLEFSSQQNSLCRILEIGTGSGGIAHFFASRSEFNCDVTAVDVVDNRQLKKGYDFLKVDGVELPFLNGSFDLVISNHVIEHVGERKDQLQHLLEIKRVMSESGQAYLAVPNRWMLIEPHYKLAFLSWLPRSLRTFYLRRMKKGQVYDCLPLSLRELTRLIEESGLSAVHLEQKALQALIEIEDASSSLMKLSARMPKFFFGALRWLVPTLICSLRK